MSINPGAIRAIFYGLPLLIMVQEVLVIPQFAEPYPGLRMPGFLGAGKEADGAYTFRQLTVEAYLPDGSRHIVKRPLLLDELPSSIHGALEKQIFEGLVPAESPVETRVAFPARARSSIDRYLLRGLPAFRMRFQRRKANQLSDETREWLVARLTSLLGSAPTSVDLVWADRKYYLDGSPTKESNREVYHLEIPR